MSLDQFIIEIVKAVAWPIAFFLAVSLLVTWDLSIVIKDGKDDE